MIYILKNDRDEYYIGHTLDIRKRMLQHRHEHPGFILYEIRNYPVDEYVDDLYYERETIEELIYSGKKIINKMKGGWTGCGRTRHISEEERLGRAEYYQMYNELERGLAAEMANNYW